MAALVNRSCLSHELGDPSEATRSSRHNLSTRRRYNIYIVPWLMLHREVFVSQAALFPDDEDTCKSPRPWIRFKEKQLGLIFTAFLEISHMALCDYQWLSNYLENIFWKTPGSSDVIHFLFKMVPIKCWAVCLIFCFYFRAKTHEEWLYEETKCKAESDWCWTKLKCWPCGTKVTIWTSAKPSGFVLRGPRTAPRLQPLSDGRGDI